MERAPVILIATPILCLVVVTALDTHSVQLGVTMMLTLGIGLATSPVGSAIFVGCAVGKTSIEKVPKAMLPFLRGDDRSAFA